MKNAKWMIVLLTLAVLGLTATAAEAQTGQFYIGAGLGTTHLDTGFIPITANLDEDDTGFQLQGGFQIMPQLSLEMSYVNLGKAKLTGNAGDQVIIDGVLYNILNNNTTLEFKTSLFSFGGRYSLPLSPTVDLNARLGLSSWKVDMSASAPGAGGGAGSTSGTDLYYGLGLGWEFMPSFSLLVDYNHYDLDTQSAYFISLGISKRF